VPSYFKFEPRQFTEGFDLTMTLAAAVAAMLIARALVAGARVVALDDPMSAVDTQTERHLVENLRPALAGRTVLIATQRLSTVEVADRAVVVDNGVIVESGTPAELLARGGLFAELFGEEVSAAA